MEPNLEVIIAGVKGVVGESNVLTEPDELESFRIDGNLPKGVVFPSNSEEISRVVQLASSENFSIIPWGGGTKIDMGNIPKKVDLVISLRRLGKVVEHDPLNLNVTVEAGARLDEVQSQIGEKGQFIALDPPFVKEATIGGIIASDSSGPKRYLFGTCRDLVLGLEAVLPNGDIVKAGGKTVKNVTGYDMNKLFIGSFGTLGIITQGTFKLLPLPEDEKIIILSFKSIIDLKDLTRDILRSVLVPSSLEILNPLTSDVINNKSEMSLPEGSYHLIIGVEGAREAVEREVLEISQRGEEKGAFLSRVLERDEMRKLCEILRNLTTTIRSGYPDFMKCKASVLISKTLDMIQRAEALADKYNLKCGITSHGGNGIVSLYFLTEGSNGNLKSIIADLTEAAKKLDGSFVVERAASEIKRDIDVWGSPEKSLEVMRAIKNQFDSKGLFNPGRFLGGI